MISEINLRIVVEKPPPDVEFGLQLGSGNKYQTIQKQKATSNENFIFSLVIKIKGDQQKYPKPDFLGPHTQGTPFNRFIYLDIGTYAGQTTSIWSRRLKIPLTGITWRIIDQLTLVKDGLLETQVPGTGKDGGPNCATVKPFDGWQIKTLRSK